MLKWTFFLNLLFFLRKFLICYYYHSQNTRDIWRFQKIPLNNDKLPIIAISNIEWKTIVKEKGCPNFVLIQTWRQIYYYCSQLHLDTNWKWAKVLHSLPWRKLHSQRMVNCHLIMFSKIQSHISFTFVTSWQWKRLIEELPSQRKQQTQTSSTSVPHP